MKVKIIVILILILLSVLINDSLYFMKKTAEKYLNELEKKAEERISEKTAVMVIEGDEIDNVLVNISNQYYVDSVKVLQQEELVSVLAEQYDLQESQNLLRDMELPQVAELYFKGDSFKSLESDLFLETIEEQDKINRLLFSADSYRDNWEALMLVEKVRNLISKYWGYLYYGGSLIIIMLLFFFRMDLLHDNSHYWNIYRKAGGRRKFEIIHKIAFSILLAVIPLAAAFGVENLFQVVNTPRVMPDLSHHLIRGAAGLLASCSVIVIFRERKNE